MEKKEIEYKLLSPHCVNSTWLAFGLNIDRSGECCECGFECKVKVLYIKSNYQYIITVEEFNKLKKEKLI